MTPEIPATRIAKLRDWGTSKMYRVTCDCTDPQCEHTVDVSSEDGVIVVTTYTKQRTNWWSRSRWSHIWKLLITGYVEYEASIMMSKQVALNYINVLQCCIDDVEAANAEDNHEISRSNKD